MLERLQVINFQPHSDTRLRLGRVTTIVGPSDVGKSALVRALRWLAFNRPAGLGFIRHGAPGAVVRLWVDGRTIARKRTKTTNAYALDGKPLQAMGQTVPDTVAALLNVDEGNFQTQFDPTFWLAKSPAEVSRALNAIVNLDVIDDVLGRLAALVRSATTTADHAATQAADARSAAAGFTYVGDLAASFKTVETLTDDAARSRDLLTRRQALLAKVRQTAKTRQTAAAKAAAAAAVAAVVKQAAAAQRRTQAVATLLATADAAGAAVGLGTAARAAAALDGIVQAAGDARRRADSLRQAIAAVADAQTRADVARAAATAAVASLNKLTRGRCPLCQQPWRPNP